MNVGDEMQVDLPGANDNTEKVVPVTSVVEDVEMAITDAMQTDTNIAHDTVAVEEVKSEVKEEVIGSEKVQIIESAAEPAVPIMTVDTVVAADQAEQTEEPDSSIQQKASTADILSNPEPDTKNEEAVSDLLFAQEDRKPEPPSKEEIILPDDLDQNLEYQFDVQKRQAILAGEQKEYLESHPDVKAFLSDYLMAVLQAKPEDVYGFTQKHFSSRK